MRFLTNCESIHHAANNAIKRGGVKDSPLEYGVV